MRMSLACQICGESCNDAHPCPACGALYYCSAKHLHIHRRLGHDAEECTRMQKQLERRQDIYNFNVQWPIKSSQEICKWLQQQRCHDSGLLQYCCPVHPVEAETLQPAHQQYMLLSASYNSDNSRERSRQPCCIGLPSTDQDWCKAWAPLGAEQVPRWPWALNAAKSLTVAVDDLQQEGSAQHKQLHQQQLQQSSAGQPREQVRREAQQPIPKHKLLSMVPQSWSDYYLVRGIPEESPAALALHFPLTLWYCLAVLLPSRGWQLPPKGHSVSVAYLGPQAELCILPVFLELLALLPGYDVSIHMIGPDVPEHLHGRANRTEWSCDAGQGSITISCWNGCWHDIMQDWQQQGGHKQDIAAHTAVNGWVAASSPATGSMHLVFAANAGLPVFPSWMPTLQHLLAVSKHGGKCAMNAQAAARTTADTSSSAAVQMVPAAQSGPASTKVNALERAAAPEHELLDSGCGGLPIVFSDYCEEAAVKSQQMMQAVLAQGFDQQALLNPFRQPVPSHHHGTKLPACSNCFLFGWL